MNAASHAPVDLDAVDSQQEPQHTLTDREGDVFVLSVLYFWIRFHLHAAFEEALHPVDEEKLMKLPKDRVQFALQHLRSLPKAGSLVKELSWGDVQRLFAYLEAALRNQVTCDEIRQRPSYYDLPSLRDFCIVTSVDMLTFAQFFGWISLPPHLRIRWFEEMTIREMEEKCKIIEYVLARRALDLAALQRFLPDLE
jgi:hypothetical protein